ncbi:endonuclease/exonuclease/phosphatase family protein [Kiloniella laminariae]|uniref:endonuclease/exonuclease/phosphatase family protein n=1 Tax=Kiloniella laminariae TaxID=454162 RepID=UPI00037EC0CE|nr:endonuclease/exonuclease/phosphatase family protein [Kiloniella laminariae]
MISLVSWNIQCGRGTDNLLDLERIASIIKTMGTADIICLQEVARFYPELDDGAGEDQVAALARFFPQHLPIFGAAISRQKEKATERSEFGNMILSRYPVSQLFNHQLPQPCPAQPSKHMPRQALEAIIILPDGPLRVITTHLEYHSESQRLAQAAHLTGLHQELVSNSQYHTHAPDHGPYAAVARPERTLLCGDFNSAPDDAVYRLLSSAHEDISAPFRDAWRRLYPKEPHAPTCGIFDHIQWPEGPHCRDFFFVTKDLLPRLNDISVQQETNASDHQPVALRLKIG